MKAVQLDTAILEAVAVKEDEMLSQQLQLEIP
jgi:hypothetical protein